MPHDHQRCCEHNQVQYCKVCELVYCVTCKREWRGATTWAYGYTYPAGINLTGTTTTYPNTATVCHTHGE